ncbi:MAG: hypothetical protein WBA55_11225 [Allopontixanthobacter sediminis]
MLRQGEANPNATPAAKFLNLGRGSQRATARSSLCEESQAAPMGRAERIEWASFDWEDGEAVPGPRAPAGTSDEDALECEKLFTRERSWYVS